MKTQRPEVRNQRLEFGKKLLSYETLERWSRRVKMKTLAMTEPLEESHGTNDADRPSGGRLVTPDGREMSFKGAKLRASAGSGLARVVLIQRFSNPHPVPLNVSYVLPLPPDGAVSGFDFHIDDQRIKGEVVPRPRARERFEEAIAEGRSAAIQEQERTSLFTQEVGNIPSKSEVITEVIIDQKLCWLSDGSWEWQFPTVVGPRHNNHNGRGNDSSKPTFGATDGDPPAEMGLVLSIRDALTSEDPVASPSHQLDVHPAKNDVTEVSFESGSGVHLDRDIVVRWAVSSPEVSVSVTVAHPSDRPRSKTACGLVTIIPPEPKAGKTHLRRDLIFLIDTSGSMSGQPLCQAAAVAAAMINTLGANDRIELIEFSHRSLRFADAPIEATSDGKRSAIRWMRGLHAGGPTEMFEGIKEALAPLRPDSQRQIVLITDGYIGFEREIITTLLDQLPTQTRLHSVGVGSAINRSLTAPAARAGRGIEVIVGPDEDVEPVVARLLAGTTRPLVTNVRLSSQGSLSSAPLRPPDLFAGRPVLIAVELDTSGGTLTVTGEMAGGVPFSQTVSYPAAVLGQGDQGISSQFARERCEDLETQIAAGFSPAKLEVAIERIGVAFQIATRLTSWIAVRKTSSIDVNEPARRQVIAHEVPFRTSIEGFGLRPARPSVMAPTRWDPNASAPPSARSDSPSEAKTTPPPLPEPDAPSKKESTLPSLSELAALSETEPTPPPLPELEALSKEELTPPPLPESFSTRATKSSDPNIPQSRLMALLDAPKQPKTQRTRREPGPKTEEPELIAQVRGQIIWLVVLTFVIVALFVALSLFMTGCSTDQHKHPNNPPLEAETTVDDRS